MVQTDPVLSWLKKAVLASAFLLLCILCALAGLLLSILMDVRQQVSTLREQTVQVAAGLTMLERTVAQLTDPKLVSSALQRGVEHLPFTLSVPPAASAVAQQEIAYLLQCIGGPELIYEYEGKQRPAEWVQMKLNGKGMLQGSTFASSEEFIDKVATKTSEGSTYYVVDKQGTKAELQAWLRERLQEFRSAQSVTPERKESHEQAGG